MDTLTQEEKNLLIKINNNTFTYDDSDFFIKKIGDMYYYSKYVGEYLGKFFRTKQERSANMDKNENRYNVFNYNFAYPIIQVNEINEISSNELTYYRSKLSYLMKNKYNFIDVDELKEIVPDLKCLIFISYIDSSLAFKVYAKYYYSDSNPNMNCYISLNDTEYDNWRINFNNFIFKYNGFKPCSLIDLNKIKFKLYRLPKRKKMYLRDFNYFIDTINRNSFVFHKEYELKLAEY